MTAAATTRPAMSEADRVIDFIERFLTLGQSFLGQPFDLLPFQRELIEDIYAEDGDTGRRLRRTYLLGLPRKNGKSQLGAALALYHLIGDRHDDAPQVYSAAGDRAQAKLVFNEARRMIEMSPALSTVAQVFRNEIRCTHNRGVYRTVSSDAGLQQGLNPSFCVFDELHIFKNSDLYDAMTMGSAQRNNPLTLVISTAGYDLDTPLGRLYEHGLRVDGHRLNGVEMPGELADPSFGMTWYGPTQSEMTGGGWDHHDPDLWNRYNPAWPVMPNPIDEFTTQLNQKHESSFIRFFMNGWTTSATGFLPLGAWDAIGPDGAAESGAPPVRPLEAGDTICLGFDGAWKGDSTALVAVRTGDLHMAVLGHWEAPANDPDWRTPAPEVEAAVLEACELYRVVEMAADPYRFEQSLLKLQEEHGVPILEWPTNSRARMCPATSGFYQGVMDGEFSHDGNLALARHLSNAVVRETPVGALITKEARASRRHIDLAIAAIVALSRARLWRGDRPQLDDSPLLFL